MRKLLNWIIASIYILILMVLSVFLFWELYAKDYINDKINSEIGEMQTDTKQTKNNSELILQMLNNNNDES